MISRQLFVYAVIVLSFCSLMRADNVFVGAATGAAVGSLIGHPRHGALAGALWAASSNSTQQASNKKQVKIVNNTAYKAWIGIHRNNACSVWHVRNITIESGGDITVELAACSSWVAVEGVLSLAPGDYSKNITLKGWSGATGDITLQIVDEGNNNYRIKEV